MRQARSRPLWDELQDQALSRVRTGGVHTLESVAKELNMSLGTPKGSLKKEMRRKDRALAEPS